MFLDLQFLSHEINFQRPCFPLPPIATLRTFTNHFILLLKELIFSSISFRIVSAIAFI